MNGPRIVYACDVLRMFSIYSRNLRMQTLLTAATICNKQVLVTKDREGGALAEWVRALACTGDRTVPAGFESQIPNAETSLRNIGNSVYPALPVVSFGGDTKSRRSLLSGVYARGSKYPTSPHWNVYCRGLHHPL